MTYAGRAVGVLIFTLAVASCGGSSETVRDIALGADGPAAREDGGGIGPDGRGDGAAGFDSGVGDGGADVGGSQTLSVTVSGSGAVTSSPAGINCTGSGGDCSASFPAGTAVTLAASPDEGWAFSGWQNDCAGATSFCSVTMDADRAVGANFDGPFDFTLTSTSPWPCLTMIPGQSRVLPLTLTRIGDAALPVDLSVSNLPAGVTVSFSPAQVTPDGIVMATVTTALSAPVANVDVTVTVTAHSATTDHTLEVPVVIRPPIVVSPVGVAIEDGGATALVTEESFTGGCPGALVRMDVPTRRVTEVIASPLEAAADLVIESGGQTALVATAAGIVRVVLATGVTSIISSGVNSPYGIALESSTKALVTDCALADCSTDMRVARVDLTTGVVMAVTPVWIGLQQARSLVLEETGTALVAENGGQHLLRVNCITGAVTTVATTPAPVGVALEPGGQTALVNSMEAYVGLHRVNVVTGATWPIATIASANVGTGLAIEAGGARALVAAAGQVLRVNIVTPLMAVAPGQDSLDRFVVPAAVALEPGNATALVVDYGPSVTDTSGRVERVDLATGDVSPIATGLWYPVGVALEPAGTGNPTALVTEADRLTRVDLTTGTASTVTLLQTTGSNCGGGTGVVVESASHALVGDSAALVRVNLSSGAKQTVASYATPVAIALEADGATALASSVEGWCSIDPADGSLLRVDLTSGATNEIASRVSPLSVVAETPTTALATLAAGQRLVRFNLTTGRFTVLATAPAPLSGLALEPAGTALLTAGDTLVRATLDDPYAPTSVVHGLSYPAGLAMEAGGTTALFLAGMAWLPGHGHLWRVDLATGALTDIASALNCPQGLAIEPSGSALVVETGCANNQGRLVRVTMAGVTSVVSAGGYDFPDGIAIEPGGATALVVESNPGRLLRITLADGSYEVMAAGLPFPTQVSVEAGGATAIVSGSGGLIRVDLASRTFTSIVSGLGYAFWHVIEPGGATALLAAPMNLSSSDLPFLARVNLSTGGTDILCPGFLREPRNLVFTGGGGGKEILIVDTSWLGTIFRLTLP